MSKTLLALLALAAVHAKADLVISEFLAANTGLSLLDEDGDSSDWLEIHNTGNTTVSLSGYTLTDDPSDPYQWTLPAVSIPAGDYLVVFASSKDRSNPTGELHTNFKLSADGEYLALVDPLGQIVHHYNPEFPEQEDDISYGLGPDGVTYGYFIDPTPGAANALNAAGRVEDTQFSVGRGIFHQPFQLEITTATPDAVIRYTTDGSSPTESNGTVYTAPITISGTTIVRAAAFKPGYFPTNIDTQTYLFPSDVRNQYADGSAPPGWPASSVNSQVYDYGMDPDITSRYTDQEMEDALTAIPSVSITTDIENLNDPATGIYANATNSGSDWERVAHFEMFGGDLASSASARCGLRVRGGASRDGNNPKHAFRLFFRGQYGDPKLEFPLFGPEGVDEFDKIDFRTAQNYSWSKDNNKGSNTFLRDVLGRDLQGALGQPYTRSRYCHLYLNGVYWGLFMSQERSEANWGESYLGGNDEDFETLKPIGRYNPNRYDTYATDGDMNAGWLDLWNLVKAQHDNPTTARYYQMQGLDPNGNRDPSLPVLLDVDNLIDYILLLGFTGAYDNSLSKFVGASNNWYSVRDTTLGARGFVHLLHDAEHSLGAGGSNWNNHNDRINTTNGIEYRDDFNKSNPQFLHMDLADSTPEYRQRFADRAHEVLFNNGPLTKDRVLELLEKRRQTVEQVIIAESARWGDSKQNDTYEPADKEDWEGAVASLVSLFDTRTSVFLGHLRAGNLYPDTDSPLFSPFAENVPYGTGILISASEGTIYYTTDGSDPRLESGAVNPSSQAIIAGGSTGGFSPNSTWKFDDSGTDHGSSDLVAGHPGYDSSNWKHPDFNDSSWSSGTGIFGFGSIGSASITTPMGQGTAPGGNNPTTSYLRKEFTVNDVNGVTLLNASVLADDGPIIYLNGVEVYRSNLNSGTATYSTYAINAVSSGNEDTYNTFSIDPSLLVDGTNVIAAEIHQVNATSSDLGFDMELTYQNTSGAEFVVTGPLTLNARVLNAGEWSALTSNYYSTGIPPEPGDLAISEVHYHPANPSTSAELAAADSDTEFEFIELANISPYDLELRGVRLAEQVVDDHLEGVSFTFTDGFLLPPGERVVIVENIDAFLARYPGTPASAIAGTYSGELANSGEWLELRNARDTVIASFRFDDAGAWPAEADGDGMSLQLASLHGGVDYSDPDSWMAVTEHGSPGVSGPAPFSGSPDEDADGDGIPALVEYFNGTSDSHQTSQNPTELSFRSESGEDGIFLTFTRDPEAIGVTAFVEQSDQLGSWSAPPGGSSLVSREILPGNLLRETYRVSSGSPSESRLFFRLKVTSTD